MENASQLKALFVSEGSGGHLIPALEVAMRLARSGTGVKVWYARRDQIGELSQALLRQAQDAQVDVSPIPIRPAGSSFARLWQCGVLWSKANECIESFKPDVVVGFGGWISAPVLLAARKRHISCLLHEQNVVMGRANRLLSRWVNRVAVSFPETQRSLRYTSSIVTGMPIRTGMFAQSNGLLKKRIGFDDDRPAILILGGSQGSRFINLLMTQIAAKATQEERANWQFIHITGAHDEALVKEAYANAKIRAWVIPFYLDMAAAYKSANLVISRAGASTIAELARCARPSILIPYPFAFGHQMANAQLVESVGGTIAIEESKATPLRVLANIRRILADARLQRMMAEQVRTLDFSDASGCLTEAILALSRS